MKSFFQRLRDRLYDADIGFRKIRFYLLTFFVLTMPMVFYLGNTEYGYVKTIYSFLFISLVVLVWVGEMVLRNRMEVTLTGLAIPVGMLIVASLFSLINASSNCAVVQSLALVVYFFLFYLLIVNTVNSEREMKYLLFALLFSGVISSFYGILQYLGTVAGPFGTVPGRDSIISMMGNRNYLGGFVSYQFIPAVTLVFLVKRRWIKALVLLSVGTLFFILFPVGAEGVWLGLIVGFLVFVIGLFVLPRARKVRPDKFWLLGLILILLLAFLFASAPSPLNSMLVNSATEDGDKSRGILEMITQPLINQFIMRGGPRLEDWDIGVEMVKDHPIIGLGLGNYKIKFLEYRKEFLTSAQGEGFGDYIPRGARTHNEYLQMAAELGAFGILIIIFGVVYLLKVVIQRLWQTDKPSLSLLGLSLFAGITAFLVHAAVSFPAHLPASSIVFVLFLGLLNSKCYGKNRLKFRISGLVKHFLIFITLVVMLSVSVISFRDWRANLLMAKGINQTNYGNYRIAKEHFLKSVRKDFCPRHVYYYLGTIEIKLGNNESALSYFNKSLGQFEPYSLFYNLGSLYANMDDLGKARHYLKTLLATGPKKTLKVDVLYTLATVEVRSENYEAALERTNQLLELKPDYTDAYMLTGSIADYRGNKNLARKEWKKALSVAETNLDVVKKKIEQTSQAGRLESLTSRRKSLTDKIERIKKKLDEL